MSLKNRLQTLERTRRPVVRDDWSERVNAAFDALDPVLLKHYPSDIWPPSPWTNSILGKYKNHSQKRDEASARVAAGTPSEIDLAAMAELPTEALATLDMTPSEYMVFLTMTLDSF